MFVLVREEINMLTQTKADLESIVQEKTKVSNQSHRIINTCTNTVKCIYMLEFLLLYIWGQEDLWIQVGDILLQIMPTPNKMDAWSWTD